MLKSVFDYECLNRAHTFEWFTSLKITEPQLMITHNLGNCHHAEMMIL